MKKTHEIRVKVDNDEHKKITAKAKKLGLTASTFLRFLGVSSNLPTNFLRSSP